MNRRGICTFSADWNPESISMFPRTNAANMNPNPLDTNIRPFAKATSLSLSTSTAKASELTSCKAAKILWIKKNIPIAARSVSGSSISKNAAIVTIIPNCENNTHGRRLPIVDDWKRSIIGPNINFPNIQGKVPINVKAATSSSLIS